ncbi:PhnD ABC-type phosphate/phosphonate transport system, periplasmic component [Burkholderiales bacterium]
MKKHSFLTQVVLTSLLVMGLVSPGRAEQMLRISSIPEEAATEQVRKLKPLADYLSRETGMKVIFTPVNDYPAAVEALVNKKIDLVWLGGSTFVQAKIRSKNTVVPLLQRQEDTDFKSVFITRVGSGITKLQDLKGKTVSFGSPSSTSGHLMPRKFLMEVGLEPERDFRRIAYSKAHDAAIAAVASGQVDAAAIDITVWQKFVSEQLVDTTKVAVFHTTPGFYNYNWTVHQDMPKALQEKIVSAFLKLSPSTPEGQEILKLNRATRYIRTEAKNYDGIEAAARAAGLLATP